VDAESAGFIGRFAAGLHGSSSLPEAPSDAVSALIGWNQHLLYRTAAVTSRLLLRRL
jgi:hypothetical protein